MELGLQSGSATILAHSIVCSIGAFTISGGVRLVASWSAVPNLNAPSRWFSPDHRAKMSRQHPESGSSCITATRRPFLWRFSRDQVPRHPRHKVPVGAIEPIGLG